MIAIAWTDTPEGRRWTAACCAMVLVAGAAAVTFGRLVLDDRILWVGGDLVLVGSLSMGWAFFHRARGLPVPRVATEAMQPAKTRPCIVAECHGTMTYHEPLEGTDAPHTLEWPWRASWRCSQDPTHVELVVEVQADGFGSGPGNEPS